MAQPDPTQIQGDVLLGLQKNTERFIFFNIVKARVDDFKKYLGETTFDATSVVKELREEIKAAHRHGPKVIIPMSHKNVAFTAKGLVKLGIDPDDMPKDGFFRDGQLKDAAHLGDTVETTVEGNKTTVTPTTWISDFQSGRIDGVFLVTAHSSARLQREVQALRTQYGNSVEVQYEITGNARPGCEKGHEHFGFKDGISIPTIASIKPGLPGQDEVEPKVLLTGFNNDEPDWCTNGSYLVFRQLEQHVPEFRQFTEGIAKSLATAPDSGEGLPLPTRPNITPEFIGARLVGRWASGAPLDLSPDKDDPYLAADEKRNNKFNIDQDKLQEKCPYAAHTRKTNPRDGALTKPGAGFNIPRSAVLTRLFTRHGIPYGPELSTEEANAGKTLQERGLLFVSYQASIERGFRFVQHDWCNSETFPPENFGGVLKPGFDQIVGQNNGAERRTQGIGPDNQLSPTNDVTSLTEFVVSRGGEYFFSPSINGIKKLAGNAVAKPGLIDQAAQFVNQAAQKI